MHFVAFTFIYTRSNYPPKEHTQQIFKWVKNIQTGFDADELKTFLIQSKSLKVKRFITTFDKTLRSKAEVTQFMMRSVYVSVLLVLSSALFLSVQSKSKKGKV